MSKFMGFIWLVHFHFHLSWSENNKSLFRTQLTKQSKHLSSYLSFSLYPSLSLSVFFFLYSFLFVYLSSLSSVIYCLYLLSTLLPFICIFFCFWLFGSNLDFGYSYYMMKKMKGFETKYSSPYAVSTDHQRFTFRHQSLMQDFQDLEKETNAMKQKMDLLRHKKMNLMAEVRFLRQRYEYLMKYQLASPPQPENNLPIKSSKRKNKNIIKEKAYKRKEATKQRSDSAFDFEEIDHIFNGKEATLSELMPLFKLKQKTLNGKRVRTIDLNQEGAISGGTETTARNSALVFDLNLKERSQSGNEALTRNHPPVFDLNQISREEEDIDINEEDPRVEEAKTSTVISGNEKQSNDMEVVGFRNAGNGPNKVGKRKISWQDQVALKV